MRDYFDLGSYSRSITTRSPEAQSWFDRGLNWCYGFNQEEGICCFQKAVEFDPTCAIAYWGVAYAKGPFYNKTWEQFGQKELKEMIAFCYETLQLAHRYIDTASPIEQALIRALSRRHQSGQAVSEDTLQQWTDSYAATMRDVYQTFPHEQDVSALYAEAMLNRTPWQLWDVNRGEPAANADTVVIMHVLEKALQKSEEQSLPPHPALLHLYIHTMEMSPTPEKALRAADALRNLQPDGGHLLHMPSHIDLLCGHYHAAIVANDRAIAADKKYLEKVGPFNFYVTACCHNYHFKMYAAMFLGQYKAALEAANGIKMLLIEAVLRTDKPYLAHTVEGYYSTAIHVHVRFGKWQEIIDMPMPPDPQLYLVTTAMYHYAKGVAYAALGEIESAGIEEERFEQVVATVPMDRYFFNNYARNMLMIGSAMLAGELAYRKGDYEAAFAHLRQAVALDDRLAYTEPWAWMHPPRHALGALLLEQGHITEAEQLYRADLGLDHILSRPSQHPDNVWSLHGYHECLIRQGRDEEATALQFRLKIALARADVEIHASCCCRKTESCCHTTDSFASTS